MDRLYQSRKESASKESASKESASKESATSENRTAWSAAQSLPVQLISRLPGVTTTLLDGGLASRLGVV
jgi:hypothetical protein